jgi:hypothetical protein
MVVRFWGLLLLPSLALAGHDKNAQLVSKGWNPVASLGHCQGDCDSDKDCRSGLACVQRSGWKDVVECAGDAKHNMDYCIDAKRATVVGWSPTHALEHCHGDCDADSDCRSGLFCYQRRGGDALPHCAGMPLGGMDYCVDPNHIVEKGWQSVEKRGGLLEHCHGDCDSDADCVPGKGLRCILRSGDVVPKALEACNGALKRNMDYCVNTSPVDCKLGAWSKWNACSKSCKRGDVSGSQSAKRLVTPPQFGGIPCKEKNVVPIWRKKWQACNTGCCPGFWAEEQGMDCVPHRTCKGHEFQTRKPTATSDRVCERHTECLTSEYETAAPGTHHDRKCWPCTKGFRCDGSVSLVACSAQHNEYQDQTNQASCESCKSCPRGQIRVGCGGPSGGRCMRCPSGYHKVDRYSCEVCAAGTFAVDGAECRACTPGRYSMKGAKACTSCAAGSYQPESKQGTCLPCEGGWTHTTGPELEGHTSERPSSSLLALWKAKTAGHVGCTAYTVCSETKYETKAVSKVSDRECEDHTVCQDGEFASVVAGTHNNRVCSVHSICEPGKVEAWAATVHNDRECEAAKVCSHVTCRHEEHHCSTHKEFKRQVAVCAKNPFMWRSDHADQTKYQTPCQQWSTSNICDRKKSHWSVRVTHHKAEKECRRGHICAMEGNQCVCKQRYMDRPDAVTCQLANSDNPTNKPHPRHVEACFRVCRASGEAQACRVAAGFQDVVRPEIKMCAMGTIKVPRHEAWNLCKSTAMDNIDGDVTSAIRYAITGPIGAMQGVGAPHIDTALCEECTFVAAHEVFEKGFPGNYMVTMTACDAHENCAKGAFAVTVQDRASRLSCDTLPKFRSISKHDQDASVCASSYCDARYSAFPGNGQKKSYTWAKAHCESVGARLCTYKELASCQTCLTGCGHDARLVWSQTSEGCNAGEHVMEVGRPESADRAMFPSRRSCRKDDELKGSVRCCADSVGRDKSEQAPALVSHGYSPDDQDLPLGKCHGDCDADSDCAHGHVCHQQHAKDAIPGCEGSAEEGMDYCVAV